jgi:hypothetical protein
MDEIAGDFAFIRGDWDSEFTENHGLWMYWAETLGIIPV